MRTRRITLLAATAALATGLSTAPATAVAAPQPSRTVTPIAAVPTSKCAPIGHLYNGLCFGYTADGKQIYNWLGTYSSPAGQGWGADYIYTTAWSSGSAAKLYSSAHGTEIDTAESGALAALTAAVPPASSNNTDVAAVALIIREVMGDGDSPGKGQIIPSGLKSGGTVKKTDRLSIPPSVYQRAQELWNEASAHSVPQFDLEYPGPDQDPDDELTFTATLTWHDGSPIANTKINLDYSPHELPDPGVPETMFGPASVTTDAQGKATFTTTLASQTPDPPSAITWEISAATDKAFPDEKASTWQPASWSGRDAGSYPSGPTRVIASGSQTGKLTFHTSGYVQP